MEFLANPETWIALITLTALEIVLGIDNIVFISIMAGKLPPEQRDLARQGRKGIGEERGDPLQPVKVARPRVDRRPRLDLGKHRRRHRALDALLFECCQPRHDAAA